MKYENTVNASFIKRLNRFTAEVSLNGLTETVHVKNTGRLGELLLPGASVTLQKASNPERKTKYDLISVYRDGLGWVNIDSQASNALVREWLEGPMCPFDGMTLLKPEKTYGASRVDFYIECGERKIFIEVKGCTLERNGIGLFPDAPTDRGVKHLSELSGAVKEGYECFIAFVIAMNGIELVEPNRETHPEFADALEEAVKSGVRMLFLPCRITKDTAEITYKGDKL